MGSSEERGAFIRNATKTWVEGGDLPSVCRAAPLSSLVPVRAILLLRLLYFYLKNSEDRLSLCPPMYTVKSCMIVGDR